MYTGRNATSAEIEIPFQIQLPGKVWDKWFTELQSKYEKYYIEKKIPVPMREVDENTPIYADGVIRRAFKARGWDLV